MLPATKKDRVPTTQQSNVVYQFSYYCDSSYVGRTSQRLQDRIKQHVPKRALEPITQRQLPPRSCKSQLSTQSLSCESAIGQHLLCNKDCAANYNDSRFSVLSRGRTHFHLSTLEAIFIKTKDPNLCRQKEFIYKLKILH